MMEEGNFERIEKTIDVWYEDVKQSHASAIESYIEKHVGVDDDGTFRDTGDMGEMY